MRPNLAMVVVARLTLGVFAGLSVVALPANAGDRALANFIGFSPNARYFAFEEFGIEADSGLAYSRIFFIDRVTNSWVPKTPIGTVAEEDESGNLAAIREETSRKAESLMDELNIVIPAEIAALNGDGEPGRDPMRLALLYPIPAWGIATRSYSLVASFFPAEASVECAVDTDGHAQGLEVRLIGKEDETVVHRDEGLLPQSRGCPQSYDLYAVVVPGIGTENDGGVAIVSFYPSAYEGANRRFLAVPFEP